MITMITTKVLVCVCSLLAAVHIRKSNAFVEPLNYLPDALQSNLDLLRESGDLTQQSGRLMFWIAINQFCTKFVKNRPDLTPDQSAYLSNSLQDAFYPFDPNNSGRVKRQAALAPRIRPEIRAMTRRQRRRYFRAVNAMKRNRQLPPNNYDFLMNYHRGANLRAAHMGPAFLPWHRLYLWIFEYFLRLEEPQATLPYWASVLDNGMDFANSAIWHRTLFGNGDGRPRNGPFRNWAQVNEATMFTRNAQNGQLFTWIDIDNILRQDRHSQISIPTAVAGANVEALHGGPHVACGGSMSGLETAARDPIFFSHHCFVDYIWQQFQLNQTVDPETDYIFDANDPRFRREHAPNRNAGFEGLSGARFWTQRLGLLNLFRQLVRYEPIPECPRCANSRYLQCDRSRRPRRCRSLTLDELRTRDLVRGTRDTTTTRKKRQTVSTFPPSGITLPQDANFGVCPRRKFINDIDTKRADWSEARHSTMPSHAWGYIGVKVVAKRQPEYHEFNDYSLYNYKRSGHLGLKDELFKPCVQKQYEICDGLQDAVSKITIVSYGTNYDGYAEEYVLLDNRLGVSEGKAVVPVKLPTRSSPSEAVIAAFDSCGRVCTPYGKMGSTGAMVTDGQFSGAIRVSERAPQQYSTSYADALLNMWEVPSQSSCPSINYDNIPISFFCEYTDTWIWGSGNTMPGRRDGMSIPGQGSHIGRGQGSHTGQGQGSHTGSWQGPHIQPEQGSRFRPGRQGSRFRPGQGSHIGSGTEIGGIRPSRRGGRVTGDRGRYRDRTSPRARARPRRPAHRSGVLPFRGSSESTLPLSTRYSGRTAQSRRTRDWRV